MGTFVILYLIIFGISVISSVFLAGFGREKITSDEVESLIFTGIMFGLGWPVLVGMVIVAAPFLLIYQLGKFIGSRQ